MTAHLFDLAVTGNILFEGQFVQGGTLLIDEGRVSGIIDMPVDAPSGTATPETLQKKIDLVERESFIEVTLTGVG